MVDYELPGGFKEAAEEQARLEAAMKELTRGNPRVVYQQ